MSVGPETKVCLDKDIVRQFIPYCDAPTESMHLLANHILVSFHKSTIGQFVASQSRSDVLDIFILHVAANVFTLSAPEDNGASMPQVLLNAPIH
jgi:hypothetical protein